MAKENVLTYIYVSFLIKDNKLLENYFRIWDNLSKITKKGCGSKLLYSKKTFKK